MAVKASDTVTLVRVNDGAKGNTGPAGADGKDALSLVITSDKGQIAKNAAISATLTAHVYRGGSELSSDDIAKLGAIHWYASGGTEILATGSTYKASGAVVNLEARLEA